MRGRAVLLWLRPLAVVLLAGMLALVSMFIISGVFTTESEAATKTILSVTDTKIAENAPNRNDGNATTVGVDGDVGSGKDNSALIKWNVSAISPGTKVSSASVTLSVTDSSPQTYEAYSLNRAWGESTATWNVYNSGKPWQAAGAKGELDRDPAVIGTITPSAKGNQTFSLSPAVVQRWVDNPASNKGIIIADMANTDSFAFSSGESSTTSQRPKLSINLDDIPPDTTIDSGPTDIVNSGSASFAFSSSEAGSSFACKLDDADTFGACTSPTQYSNLADGEHTFQVQATDAAGNTDPTPASRTWTIDAAAPTVEAVAPTEDATDVATAANAEATFSESMNPDTLTTSTFTLAKQDTITPIEAVVTYEAAAKKATLDPTADLEANVTYTATVRGGTNGAKDAMGNPLAVDKVWSITTGSAPPADTTPPQTTITSGPSGTVDTSAANFAFSSSEANSTYECSLDSTPFSGCTSPKEYNNLASGSHTFKVRATDAAGNLDATPASRTWSVANLPLIGAGDIASGLNNNDEATAALVRSIPGTVFTLGDNVYDTGSLEEHNSYYEPTWGTEKARTKPSPGNHEYVYGTVKQYGAGYFDYFGAVAARENAGSYSYDVGDWHVISLNTGQCYGPVEADGSRPRCGPGDAMLVWLESDLKANQKSCTLAYFHHARWSSGSSHGSEPAYTKAIWDMLYANNADVVVSGHNHNYERFAPQDPNGNRDDARGIRQFVVGTGGKGLHGFSTTIMANSEVRNSSTYGVIKLTPHSGSFDWEFVPVAGKTFTDSGSQNCH